MKILKDVDCISTDFLVIGAGVAGLTGAIRLAEGGFNVLLVNKGEFHDSSSEYAQGGVAVAIAEEDSSFLHFLDTVSAGRNIGNEEAINILVTEGIERVEELIKWGANFDMEGRKYALALEAGHSRSRVMRAMGDSTGREIVFTLSKKAAEFRHIHKKENCFIADLMVENGQCRGAVAIDKKTGKPFKITARGVILASGGAGQVYSRTTNPGMATGDGYALGFRAGASIRDMEFVQFHPTALQTGEETQFLISEAVRGEGAVLKNINGRRFMPDYEPEAELATRDKVARAIYREMQKTGTGTVFLDLTHMNEDFIIRRFPKIYESCLRYNINITRNMIPVSPAMHFMMGGVVTDTDGRTSIPGLYAAGEVACTGVHGANRLASNSLLEGMVFGSRAGRAAAREGASAEPAELPAYESSEPAMPEDRLPVIRMALKTLMWEKAGIVRSRRGLSEALNHLAAWEDELTMCPFTAPGIELKNMVTAARLITLAALTRTDSIGAHFRDDG